jgi:hypothetical protein
MRVCVSILTLAATSTVIEARDLPLVTLKRQPDAFVKIVGGDVVLRTEKVRKNAHPRWEATLVLCAFIYLCKYSAHSP